MSRGRPAMSRRRARLTIFERQGPRAVRHQVHLLLSHARAIVDMQVHLLVHLRHSFRRSRIWDRTTTHWEAHPLSHPLEVPMSDERSTPTAIGTGPGLLVLAVLGLMAAGSGLGWLAH